MIKAVILCKNCHKEILRCDGGYGYIWRGHTWMHEKTGNVLCDRTLVDKRTSPKFTYEAEGWWRKQPICEPQNPLERLMMEE